MSRRTYWKEVYERNGAQWKANPQHIKESEELWAVSYWLLNHKNLVKNHSGHGYYLHFNISFSLFFNSPFF